LRVYGRLDRAGGGVDEQAIRAVEDGSGAFMRIGHRGAWALVRTDLPHIAYHEAPDGSFAIVDGELFPGGPGHNDRSSGTSSRAAAGLLTRFRKEGARSSLAALNGTASVMLWDSQTRQLVLARDRSGYGTCFWMESRGGITFGSEIQSLLRSDPRWELDEAAVDLFLAGGFISSPWTSLAHIRKVPPAHYLCADEADIQLVRYWAPSGRPKIRLDMERRKQRLEEVLLQAIERQLPGRASSALLLSGGIDSMFLAALLVRNFGVAPTGFTYRYADYDGKFNESERARAAARHLSLEHHEMIVSPHDIADNLESMLIGHNGPLSYGAHSAILRDVAASGAEVLYNGQGNGALYPSPVELAGQLLGRLPLPHGALAAGLGHVAGTRGRLGKAAAYAARVASTGLKWRFHAPLTSDELRSALYLDPDRAARGKRAAQGLFAEVISEFAGERDVERLAAPLHRLYSADGTLSWASCFGRAHGLSPRSPYYDNDYVELLYRMKRAGRKREIRELAAKLLPPELAFAPKIGQTLPITHWFRAVLAGFVSEQLSDQRLKESGLFRHEVVRGLQKRHQNGTGSHAWTLWNLIAITEWQNIARREAGLYLAHRPLRQARASNQLVRH
jgi:asparagine synthase (glutamine-hydrolysing)